MEAFSSPALVNHCIRSYCWAAGYARLNGIAYDEELLYVAALLHDLGLVRAFDNHTEPFEEAGGHVAWVFGAGAGWPVERRVRVHEVIVRHMWDAVDRDADPEGHLLELATGLDISGRDAGAWPDELRREVLERHPRLGLAAGVHRLLRGPGAAQAEAAPPRPPWRPGSATGWRTTRWSDPPGGASVAGRGEVHVVLRVARPRAAPAPARGAERAHGAAADHAAAAAERSR